MLRHNIFFSSSTGLAPPLHVPCTKMVYNTTSYLDKYKYKQMSIILFLTDVSFLQNYIVLNNLFFGCCIAASTLCSLSVVSRLILY